MRDEREREREREREQASEMHGVNGGGEVEG
jgi:hypothetical protein